MVPFRTNPNPAHFTGEPKYPALKSVVTTSLGTKSLPLIVTVF